jgi:hypothetical protein
MTSNKDTYTTVFLKAAEFPYDEQTVKTLKPIWWYSTRDKDEGGLRMTDQCLEFVETKSEIKTYKIELPKDLILGPQVLIWLDQFLNSPYHLEKRFIKVLSERTAFELYMFSGDVKKMGAAKAMNRQIAKNTD